MHDAAFGHVARGGARTLLRLLGRARIRDGLVVDLGAGIGITARVLTDAGYEVLGVELSPDMVELARRRAPAAGSSPRRCWTPSCRRAWPSPRSGNA